MLSLNDIIVFQDSKKRIFKGVVIDIIKDNNVNIIKTKSNDTNNIWNIKYNQILAKFTNKEIKNIAKYKRIDPKQLNEKELLDWFNESSIKL